MEEITFPCVALCQYVQSAKEKPILRQDMAQTPLNLRAEVKDGES
jgi:hypothetical protein